MRPRDLVSGHVPAEGAGPAGRSLKSGILVGVGPPLCPEGRLCDRGIWFLGICRQEGAGPAGRSLKSGILVGVGAALLRGSGSRILVSDILRFWNPESGNRDLESGTGIWNLETGIWKPVTEFRSMESERAGLGASARGKA